MATPGTVKTRREVQKAEFDAYLKAYPRDLAKDITGICEPPMVSYNDWTLGNWPASIVASVQLCSSMGTGESDRYFVESGEQNV